MAAISKLFCLTLASNFNNIFSTGSISPQSFYSRRGFGYRYYNAFDTKTFQRKQGSPFAGEESHAEDDFILAFDTYPEVICVEPSVRSSLMVVEVDASLISEEAVEKIESDQLADVGLYAITETVYFEVGKTRVLFSCEEDRRRALAESDRSIETKLVDAYESAIIVKPADVESFALDPFTVTKVTKPIVREAAEAVAKDARIDRMRGMLYGYALGARRSVSSHDERGYFDALEAVRSMEGTLSAELSQGRVEETARGACESELRALNKALFRQECGEGTQANFSDDTVDTFFSVAASFHWLSPKVEPFAGESVSDLQRYIQRVNAQVRRVFPSREFDPSQLPSVWSEDERNRLYLCEPNMDRTFKTLIEWALSSSDAVDILLSRGKWESGSGKGPRALFLEEYMKRYPKEQDDGSELVYLRKLYKNLAGVDYSFDVNEADDIVLRSLAAFCKKAKRDNLEEFCDYLDTQRIGQQQFALALWGAVFGFAAMDKSMGLFKEKSSVAEMEECVAKQLHSVELLSSPRIELAGIEASSVPFSGVAIRIEGEEPSLERVSIDAGLGWVETIVDPESAPAETSASSESTVAAVRFDDSPMTAKWPEKEETLGCLKAANWRIPDSWGMDEGRVRRDLEEAYKQSSDPHEFMSKLGGIQGKDGKPITERTAVYKFCKELIDTMVSTDEQLPLKDIEP